MLFERCTDAIRLFSWKKSKLSAFASCRFYTYTVIISEWRIRTNLQWWGSLETSVAAMYCRRTYATNRLKTGGLSSQHQACVRVFCFPSLCKLYANSIKMLATTDHDGARISRFDRKRGWSDTFLREKIQKKHKKYSCFLASFVNNSNMHYKMLLHLWCGNDHPQKERNTTLAMGVLESRVDHLLPLWLHCQWLLSRR